MGASRRPPWPTVRHYLDQGATHIEVICRTDGCMHRGTVALASLRLDTPLNLQGFKCPRCTNKQVWLNWPVADTATIPVLTLEELRRVKG